MLQYRDLKIIIVESSEEKAKHMQVVFRQLMISNIEHYKHYCDLPNTLPAPSTSLIFIGDEFSENSAINALRYLNGQEKLKEVPKILYTSSNEPAYVRTIVEEGVSGVLQHPMNTTSLEHSLRNFCRLEQSNEIKRWIRQALFFQEFTYNELKALLRGAIIRQYEPAEAIITKGDPADRFYLLLKGKVEVIIFEDDVSPIQFAVGEGHPFGEMGMLDRSPRSAHCIAADNCIVLEIGSQIMDDINHPIRLKLLSQLAFLLAKRVRRLNELIATWKTQSYIETPMIDNPTPIPVTTEEPMPEEDTADNLTPPSFAEVAIPTSEDEEQEKNPFTTPTGEADEIDQTIRTQEEYDVLCRKVNLRSDFIAARIPEPVREAVSNRLYSYWTGSKLSKINPHYQWDPELFTNGTHRLKKSLHLVVFCEEGLEGYKQCYLQLPFSHSIIGLSKFGCAGTFLGTDRAVHRYLKDRPLEIAIQKDLEMPMERDWEGENTIEFLTHTTKDVRNQTLFLVCEDQYGKITAKVRERFPSHQIITVVKGTNFDPNDMGTLFTSPEKQLKRGGYLSPKKDFDNQGFYSGETLFLPDFSQFSQQTQVLKNNGYIFATIGLLAQLGPNYSGLVWGSKGGAKGALKAAKARYGTKGAQNTHEMASAINWADQ